jgi:hypothetical protein
MISSSVDIHAAIFGDREPQTKTTVELKDGIRLPSPSPAKFFHFAWFRKGRSGHPGLGLETSFQRLSRPPPLRKSA